MGLYGRSLGDCVARGWGAVVFPQGVSQGNRTRATIKALPATPLRPRPYGDSVGELPKNDERSDVESVGAGLPCPPPIYRPASSPIRQQSLRSIAPMWHRSLCLRKEASLEQSG